MGLNREVAQKNIASDLNNKSHVISGDDFRRKATVVYDTQTQIQFSVLGQTTSFYTTCKTYWPHNCILCKENHPKTAKDSFKKSPFKPSSTYFVPKSETHNIINCTVCNGTGDEFCEICDENGYIGCDNCTSNGFEEISERCKVCMGKYIDNCQACSGSGVIEYKKTCELCGGTGKTSCNSCYGDGLIKCTSCDGSGETHELKIQKIDILRQYSSTGIPNSLSEKELAHDLNLPLLDFDEKNNTYWVQTEAVDAYYIKYQYEDDIYRVIVTDSGRVSWDPETPYNKTLKTSLSRKLDELKSRFIH